MPIGEVVTPSIEMEQAVKRFRAAQSMGKIAAGLESQAAELRRSVAALGLEPLKAPEGQAFNIAVVSQGGSLTIEPFIHRRCDYGDPFYPNDGEYKNLVENSGTDEKDNINVDILDYEDSRVWGYDSLHRIRVLIDEGVQVHLIDLAE